MPTPRPALALLLAAALGGCQAAAHDPAADAAPDDLATDAPALVGAPGRTAAPDVDVVTEEGPAPLAGLRGRTVVLFFAPPGDAAAAAVLDDARDDLTASGALVLAEAVGPRPSAAAEAFGYSGRPLAVVVDAEGDVRGAGLPASGDDLFALAAPTLAEAEISRTVAWGGADTLDDLVADGGLVVYAGPDAPDAPVALHLPLSGFEANNLPADLGTPLAFTGPDAAEAADLAAGWGYAAVFVADDSGALAAVEATPPPAAEPHRPGTARG